MSYLSHFMQFLSFKSFYWSFLLIIFTIFLGDQNPGPVDKNAGALQDVKITIKKASNAFVLLYPSWE